MQKKNKKKKHDLVWPRKGQNKRKLFYLSQQEPCQIWDGTWFLLLTLNWSSAQQQNAQCHTGGRKIHKLVLFTQHTCYVCSNLMKKTFLGHHNFLAMLAKPEMTESVRWPLRDIHVLLRVEWKQLWAIIWPTFCLASYRMVYDQIPAKSTEL